MLGSNPQSSSVDQQPDDFYEDRQTGQVYAAMNNVPLCTANMMSYEQLLAFYNASMNTVYNNHFQPPLLHHQMLNNQEIQHPRFIDPLVVLEQHRLTQQAHQSISSTSIPRSSYQESTSHSNTKQQQPSTITSDSSSRIPLHPPPRMTNPTSTSTPAKRGRNDVSNTSDTNFQPHLHYQQQTRVFNSNNTSIKRLRVNTHQQYDQFIQPPPQNQPVQQNQRHGISADNGDRQFPSSAARRFATSRFPFSPFSVIFSQDVRDKVVVEDLIKHASESYTFELKTIAYRRARTVINECRILVFVENTESFAFLHNESNWPQALAGHTFTMKMPSIPPQLSLVLPSVSLQIDWEDFVKEIKDKYTDIVDVIRFKNKAQQPVRAVKLEFGSVKSRNDILEEGEVSAMYMKHKVVEYYAQANVLICSKCYGIGHFRKNCPQTAEVTCKVCADKYSDLEIHHCSGVSKCIHCGGQHKSNDRKCLVVKDYRAALTRNILSGVASLNAGFNNARPSLLEFPLRDAAQGRQPVSTVSQMVPANLNDIISKKLDGILAKVEDEAKRTREMLDEFKEEIQKRDEETKIKVIALESKVEMLEVNFENHRTKVNLLLVNMCKALLDPVGVQDGKWKAYWRDHIDTLSTATALPKLTLQQ